MQGEQIRTTWPSRRGDRGAAQKLREPRTLERIVFQVRHGLPHHTVLAPEESDKWEMESGEQQQSYLGSRGGRSTARCILDGVEP